MMHRNDFVVSVQPAGLKKPYREYKIDDFEDTDDERTRQISVPFNQEYEFRFKNMKNVRRSVCIEIDGSEIGNWVIDKGSKQFPHEVTLERFSDSDKRFKILGLGDGGVDDPDNPNNGIVKITVTDEKQPVKHLYRSQPRPTRYGGISGSSCLRGSSVTTCAVSNSSDMTLGIDSSNVATGEGSKSNQIFKSTTWLGDVGMPMFFTYRFKGVVKPVISTKFCTDCGTELIKSAQFCHDCGTGVATL